MLISILLVLSLAQSQVSHQSDPAWVTDLLRSPSGQRAIAAEPPDPPPHPPSIGSKVIEFPSGSRILIDPEFERAMKEENAERRSTAGLLDENRFQEAYDAFAGYARAHPNRRDGWADLLIVTKILYGKVDEAFQDLVGFVHRAKAYDELYFLQLSYVSASRGQVYPGQMEYCYQRLQNYFNETHPGKLPEPPVESARNPRAVTLESILALGMRNSITATQYLEIAMNLDPTNEIAAKHAIELYGYKGKYSAIRRIASRMAHDLPPGESRDYYLNAIKEAGNRPDRPIHPDVPPPQ